METTTFKQHIEEYVPAMLLNVVNTYADKPLVSTFDTNIYMYIKADYPTHHIHLTFFRNYGEEKSAIFMDTVSSKINEIFKSVSKDRSTDYILVKSVTDYNKSCRNDVTDVCRRMQHDGILISNGTCMSNSIIRLTDEPSYVVI